MKFLEVILWPDDLVGQKLRDSDEIVADPTCREMVMRFDGLLREKLSDNPATTGKLLVALDSPCKCLLEWQQIEPLSALATMFAGCLTSLTLYLYGFDPVYDEAAIDATEQLLRQIYPEDTLKQFGIVRNVAYRPAVVMIPKFYGATWEISRFIDKLSPSLGVVLFRRAAAFVEQQDAGWKERGLCRWGWDANCLRERFSLDPGSAGDLRLSAESLVSAPQSFQSGCALAVRPLCSERRATSSETVGGGWSIPCDPANRPKRLQGKRRMRETTESATCIVSEAEALTTVAVHFLKTRPADLEAAISQAIHEIAAMRLATADPKAQIKDWLSKFSCHESALDVLETFVDTDPEDLVDDNDLEGIQVAGAFRRWFTAFVNEHGGYEETRRSIQNTRPTTGMMLMRRVQDKSLLTWALRRLSELIKK